MSALLYSIYSEENSMSNGVNAGMIEKADAPKHIPKTTADIAKRLAFDGFEMAVSLDLFNVGIHLRNADYCCHPTVLVVR